MTGARRDAASAAFFDAAREGWFLLHRSKTTGEYRDPRRVLPSGDAAAWEQVAARGTGRVVSWATAHGRAHDGADAAGGVVGIVELDEGPWWWGRLVGVDPGADLAALLVEVEFVASGPEPEDEMVPVFRPMEVRGER